MSANPNNNANPPSSNDEKAKKEEFADIASDVTESEEVRELIIEEGDPAEPGKEETISKASNNQEIDRIIGRGLKHPPVQDDGQW